MPEATAETVQPTSLGQLTLTTKEDWAAFSRTEPLSRPSMTRAAFQRASDEELAEFNRQRTRFHNRGAFVRTDWFMKFSEAVDEEIATNSESPLAGTGLAVSGPPGMGKTTVIAEIAKRYQLAREAEEPDRAGRPDFLPVVFIGIPERATPKGVAEQIAQFLGWPMTRSTTLNEITQGVSRTMRNCGTGLLIMDEIHNMDVRFNSGQDTDNYIKRLQNDVSATLLLAGINLRTSGLFSTGGDHADSHSVNPGQTASRFTVHDLAPYPLETAEDLRVWGEVVRSFEGNLMLVHHKGGDLIRVSRYLWHRTGGKLGPLSVLLRKGAWRAITRGTEKIDIDLLSGIQLDEESERFFAQHPLPDAPA